MRSSGCEMQPSFTELIQEVSISQLQLYFTSLLPFPGMELYWVHGVRLSEPGVSWGRGAHLQRGALYWGGGRQGRGRGYSGDHAGVVLQRGQQHRLGLDELGLQQHLRGDAHWFSRGHHRFGQQKRFAGSTFQDGGAHVPVVAECGT